MKRTLASRPLSTRSKLFAAISSVMAIAFLAVLLPTAAGGQTGGSTSTLANAGVLRLHLGAQDNFKFQVPASSPTGHYVDPVPADPKWTQSIGVSNGCKLATGGGLAGFTVEPANSAAGFVSDSIGVRTNNEGNGQPCGRIDSPSQVLAMKLGPDLPGKAIDFAELDIEGKFNASLNVYGYFVNGACPPTAHAADFSDAPASAHYDMTAGGSDSGPDSGDGDNYRLRFPKLADGNTVVNCLVFKTATGGTSLEGGSDGTAPCQAPDCAAPSLGQTIDDTSAGAPTFTSDSLFHLVVADGVLSCTDNGANGVTQGGTNGTPLTTIERFANANGDPCVPIPFNQDSSVSTQTQACATSGPDPFAQCILFQKDLLGQQAQFVWTVVWAPEVGSYQESPTQFDFGSGFNPIQLCQADDADLDTLPELPANGDAFCVFDTHTVLQVTGPFAGQVVVTEKYYGVNDPGGARH